jgi:hypothetical protein
MFLKLYKIKANISEDYKFVTESNDNIAGKKT